MHPHTMLSAPSRSRNGQHFSPIRSAEDACIVFERMLGSGLSSRIYTPQRNLHDETPGRGTDEETTYTTTQNVDEERQSRVTAEDGSRHLVNNDKMMQDYLQNLREFKLFKEYDFGGHAACCSSTNCGV